MFSLLILTLLIFIIASSAQPTVTTTYGPVVGVSQNGLNVFHSIPFAAPPIGYLRFQAPQPHTPWTTPLDVSAMPQICPQIDIIDNIYLGNEDCMYLHIYVPQNASKPLPVMFWIFGGGYVIGDGYEFGLYDGTNLALNNDVIVVAPNYRLGPFGFMALSELQAEDPNHSTGNMALLDQRFALEWVQNNIHSFGGDPTRVTIFGESAGGFSVCWHLASLASAGLFSSAIMESGNCDAPQFFQPFEEATGLSYVYADAMGCNMTGPLLLDCLRQLTTAELLTSLVDQILNPNWPYAMLSDDGPLTHLSTLSETQRAGIRSQTQMKLKMDMMSSYSSTGLLGQLGLLPAIAPIMPWGPCIDSSDITLSMTPFDTFQSGVANKVPTIMGTNKNEGSIFIPAMPVLARNTSFPPTEQDLVTAFAHLLDIYDPVTVYEVVNQAMDLYPDSEYDGDEWARGSAMLTDYFFVCSARRAARALVSIEVNPPPLYIYHFTHNMTGWIEYPLLGDYHMSELFFVWDNAWPPIIHDFNTNDTYMASVMGTYWTNMAKYGNPNSGTVPVQWPMFNNSVTDAENIEFHVPLTIEVNLHSGNCDFWDYALSILSSPAK